MLYNFREGEKQSLNLENVKQISENHYFTINIGKTNTDFVKITLLHH